MEKILWLLVLIVSDARAQVREPLWLSASDGLALSNGTVTGNLAYPASMPFDGPRGMAIYSDRRFLTDMTGMGIAYAGHLGRLPFIGGLEQEGNDEFNLRRAHFSMARKVGEQLTLSAHFSYHAASARGYGTRGKPGIGLGMALNVSERVRWAFQASDINSFSSERPHYFVRTGLGFQVSSPFSLRIEALKNGGEPVAVLLSCHYVFQDAIRARIGYASGLYRFIVSAGWVRGRLGFEINSSYHLMLGLSAGLMLSYQFKEER